MFKYPIITSKHFYRNITKTFKKYKIHKEHRTEQELCNPKKFKLQNPQKFVASYISPKTPYRNLLVFHQIGSGKTCASIGITENMKDYLKFTGKKQKIIIVASPNVQENFKLQLFDERKLKLVDGIWTVSYTHLTLPTS